MYVFKTNYKYYQYIIVKIYIHKISIEIRQYNDIYKR
ncbi:hypothetical protein, partial [Plasmodium yoelii yoelii]